jgi:hypothetical protein
MSFKLFPSKGSHLLLWASILAACVKITVNGITNQLNYCVIFTVYTQFTDLSSCSINKLAGCGFETHVLHNDECLVF